MGHFDRNLILNADDLNLTEAANEGIRAACATEAITSASVVVNYPLLASTLSIVQNYPEISIGLHFNLSRGSPVSKTSEIPTLLIASQFHPPDDRGKLFRFLHACSACEIRHELHKQATRFYAWFRRKPTHIDSHHYVHSIPKVARIVAAVALEQGIPIRRPQVPGQHQPSVDVRVGMPHQLLAGFGREQTSRDHLVSTLQTVRAGWSELPCHLRLKLPGQNSYDSHRAKELMALCDARRDGIYTGLGITLRSFADFRKQTMLA